MGRKKSNGWKRNNDPSFNATPMIGDELRKRKVGKSQRAAEVKGHKTYYEKECSTKKRGVNHAAWEFFGGPNARSATISRHQIVKRQEQWRENRRSRKRRVWRRNEKPLRDDGKRRRKKRSCGRERKKTTSFGLPRSQNAMRENCFKKAARMQTNRKQQPTEDADSCNTRGGATIRAAAVAA